MTQYVGVTKASDESAPASIEPVELVGFTGFAMRTRKQISDWVTGGSLSCSSGSSYGGDSSTPPSNSAVSVVSTVSSNSSGSTSGALVSEPAFKHLSKNTATFLVWRIQHLQVFQVVAVPKEQWGTFYDGDAYLVLAASERGQPAGQHTRTRNVRGGAEQHVHLWLGTAAAAASATAGVAAFKAAELDEALGGSAALHRELQGAESPRFIAYFTSTGIRVLRGGSSVNLTPPASPSDSPFASPVPVPAPDPAAVPSISASSPRLLRVTGRRCAVLTELPVSWTVFSQAAVFIVISGKTLLNGSCSEKGVRAGALTVWMGRYASEGLRLLAIHAALSMKDEVSACEVYLVDEGQEDMKKSAATCLRSAGLDPQRASSEIPRLQSPPSTTSAACLLPGAATPADKAAARPKLSLYHCTDKDDTCVVTEVKSGPLDMRELQTTSSYIVDHGCLGAWLWVGRQAGERERIEALRNVQGFVRKKGYPVGTPAARIIESSEPAEFQCLFRSWRSRLPNGVGNTALLSTRVDVGTLEASPKLASEARILDDGNGTMKMWRVSPGKVANTGEEDESSAVLDAAPHPSRLYSAECFVLHYSYGTRHAVFYWMGKDAPVGRRLAAARLATETANKLSPPPLVVRVVQGHEPPCLLAAFRGLLLILQGAVPSAGEPSLLRWLLLRVDGNHQMSTRAVQIDRRLAAASPSTVLRSETVLILRSPSGWTLWCGRASTGDQREAAKRLATSAGAIDIAVVLQGQEKDDFWSSLTDKTGASSEEIDNIAPPIENGAPTILVNADRSNWRSPRLFYVSSISAGPGAMPTPPVVAVEEIIHFRQRDLLADEFILLDAGDCVFAWVGVRAPRDSKRAAVPLAVAYLASDPAERDVNSPVLVVQQGYEPPLFTGFFPEWDSTISEAAAAAGPEYDSLETLRAHVEGRRAVVPVTVTDGDDDSAAREFRDFDKFPLQLLLDPDITHLPESVDVFRKELHLTHSDFVSVFGMTYPEFSRLPTWRKQSLKKSVGLF